MYKRKTVNVKRHLKWLQLGILDYENRREIENNNKILKWTVLQGLWGIGKWQKYVKDKNREIENGDGKSKFEMKKVLNHE